MNRMDIFRDAFEYAYRSQLQEISKKISEAICPLNSANLPATVIVLEDYAETLKAQEDFPKELYKVLKAAAAPVSFAADTNNPFACATFDKLLNEMSKGRGDQ